METKVVYHLHGKTGQVTVWVNDKQNSGVVNFFLEQHLPFCSNQFHLREDGREGLKLVSKLGALVSKFCKWLTTKSRTANTVFFY